MAAGKSGAKRGGGRKGASGRKSGGKKTGGKKTGASKGGRKGGAKRELIAPRGSKRLVRRGSSGKFKESDDLSSSLRQDVKKKAKTRVRSGQGDRGDR